MRSFLLRSAAYAAGVLPDAWKRAIYRLGPLASGIRSLLNRAAPEGLTEVEVAAGALKGMRLVLDLQSEKDLWLGTYEPELQAVLEGFVQPGMCVYDVGANVGYFTLQMAGRVGPDGRVFAFEPLPANLERLRRNLSLNDLESRVTVVPAAVVDVGGRRRFLTHASGGMGKVEGSAGRPGGFEGAIEVDAVDLDGFVFEAGHPAPDWVKMDVEGGEALALPGMQRVLESARPSVLLEIHGREAARAAWQAFEQAGYLVCALQGEHPPVPGPEHLPWKAYVLAQPEPSEGRA